MHVDNITLTIDASEQQKSARIERVWLDTTRPRSGQDAVVNVAMRSTRGQEIVRQVPIQIPANLTGPLQLTVADAARTTADDRRDSRGADLQRVSQLMRTFNRARRNNRIYVRLTSSDSGAVVNGEPMAGLPPSVLAVIESDRNSGTVGTLRSMTRGEWELALDFAVTGSRQLTLYLDQPDEPRFSRVVARSRAVLRQPLLGCLFVDGRFLSAAPASAVGDAGGVLRRRSGPAVDHEHGR